MVALTDMLEKVEWVHEYSKGQGYELKIPVIYEDNTSTIALGMKENNPKLRTRHLSARRCIASEFIVKDNKASIEYKKTTDMLADTLTKPVVGHLFYKLNNIMMGWLKLWPAQSIRVKGVSWKNRDIGVCVPVEDSVRVSEGKLLGCLKRDSSVSNGNNSVSKGKEKFSNRKGRIN